ncbi:MAG: right-handed parallel beta-helix repeat-containing protein, partial [Nevskiales bacterium]
MTAKQSTFNGRTSTTAAAFDPHDHARLIAARACPVTPRMLASACAVGLGLGAMNAGAATFTVKSVGDSAPGATTCAAGCTLRDAIEVANLTTATDTIKFDPAIFPLTASTTILLDMAQPDIDITTSMIITGPGPGVITIDGDADDRIFDIDNPSDPTPLVVNISGLTLTNGSVAGDGGAIETDDAKLTISNCVFSSNAATGDGGAIDSDGFYSTLTVKDSVFTGNAATGDGGAIYVDDSSRVAARSLHISNSRFSGNTASKGGGLYIESLYSPGLIENSVIDGNTATGDGGGISLYSAVERGTVTIRNTTISNNTAGSDGGGVYLYSPYAQVLIDNSTISGNSAGNDGGGIFLYYT